MDHNAIAAMAVEMGANVMFPVTASGEQDGVAVSGANAVVRRVMLALGFDLVRVSPAMTELRDAGHGTNWYHGAITNLSDGHAAAHLTRETVARLHVA